MNYWHSVLLIIIWLTVLTLAGRLIAGMLPWNQRVHARLYLGPALGLAFYLILATAVGWIFGPRPWLTISLTIGISFAALAREKKPNELARLLGFTSVAGILISFGMLASVARYGAYNVYNDTFTYLVHAQWLQEHAFRTPAAITQLQPAYTQVALYQVIGSRMGASFFLAWVQAASPFRWSIEIYPGVVSVFLIVGSLAISGLVAALVPARRLFALCWGVAAGTALSGFSYGAIAGFFPQTCGLALVTALLALLVNLRHGFPSVVRCITGIFPVSLVFAATGFAYSEMLPFVGATLVLWFAGQLFFNRKAAGQWLYAGAIFLFLTAIIWNGEILRIVRAISIQKGVTVGWPVPWSVADFYCHAAGLRLGSGEDGIWSVSNGRLAGALAICSCFLVTVAAWANFIRSNHSRRYLAPWLFAALCVGAFVYFRYGVTSPWSTGIGQTWNQYKLSNWICPTILALVGSGLALLPLSRAIRVLVIVLLAALVSSNLNRSYELAESRVAEVLRQTGSKQDPFAVYSELSSLTRATANQKPVYLDLAGQDHKTRQMLAYFLHDQPVFGDWSDDVYVYPWLPKDWHSFPIADCSLKIRRVTVDQPNRKDDIALRLGTLELSPISLDIKRVNLLGGYGIESNASGWWVWTQDQVEVSFHIGSTLPSKVRLHFEYVATNPPRTMIVTRNDGSKATKEELPLEPGWQSWKSLPFTVNKPDISFTFSSPQAPVPIGGEDIRLAVFLIKNVRLEPSW